MGEHGDETKRAEVHGEIDEPVEVGHEVDSNVPSLSDHRDEQDATPREVRSVLGRPRIIAGVAGGGILLAASTLAALWFRQRRPATPDGSPNGALPALQRWWPGRTGVRRGRTRPPTWQERLVSVAGHGRR